jgi:hypothetical protein
MARAAAPDRDVTAASVGVRLAGTGAAVFLLVGLGTGVWKFRAMATRPDHRAPTYVDIAHRASLMYSFASLVLAHLAQASPFVPWVTTAAVGVPLVCFAGAIATYVALGRDGAVENQFTRRTAANTWGMWLLVAGELGGVGALAVG